MLNRKEKNVFSFPYKFFPSPDVWWDEKGDTSSANLVPPKMPNDYLSAGVFPSLFSWQHIPPLPVLILLNMLYWLSNSLYLSICICWRSWCVWWRQIRIARGTLISAMLAAEKGKWILEPEDLIAFWIRATLLRRGRGQGVWRHLLRLTTSVIWETFASFPLQQHTLLSLSLQKGVPPALLRCSWYRTLCKFRAYNVMIWCMYILQNDYHNKVSYTHLSLTQLYI